MPSPKAWTCTTLVIYLRIKRFKVVHFAL
jgi:hypothetical protein